MYCGDQSQVQLKVDCNTGAGEECCWGCEAREVEVQTHSIERVREMVRRRGYSSRADRRVWWLKSRRERVQDNTWRERRVQETANVEYGANA